MNKNTLRIVECSVLIALSVALSFVILFKMPFGGSVTLCSMLPVMLISYRHGIKWGVGSAFVYSVINLLIGMFCFGDLLSWGMSAQAIVGSIFLDYILAFTVLGFAGIFGTKLWQYILGMLTVVFVRYIFHVISGIVIFSSTVPKQFESNVLGYSILYNSFLLPELAICLIAGILLYVPLSKYIKVTAKAA